MSIVLQGSTSGSITLQEPAIAGSTVLTLPATSGTLITTGSTGQVIPRAALPTGSVIQTVYAAYNTSTSTNSATPVAIGPQISITTTVANSKILVSLSAPTQINNGSAVTFKVSWRNSTDSYASDIAVYPAVIDGGWYELPSHFQTYSSPAVAAGTTITYKIYVARASGSGYLYLVDSWGTGASNMSIIAMEIAP